MNSEMKTLLKLNAMKQIKENINDETINELIKLLARITAEKYINAKEE
ncbi:hypothetical protein JCM30760_09930 [Thiomicrorhabdus hydrogeniphila]